MKSMTDACPVDESELYQCVAIAGVLKNENRVSRRDALLNDNGMSGMVCLLVGRLASRHLANGGVRF